MSSIEPSPSRWACDTCGKHITDPTAALVLWRDADLRNDATDWLIIHKGACDPRSRRNDPTVELDTYLGAGGLSAMLSLLSKGPIKGGSTIGGFNVDGLVDTIRRLHVPHYEDARPRFGHEQVKYDFSDSNETYPYMPEVLERIATRYND